MEVKFTEPGGLAEGVVWGPLSAPSNAEWATCITESGRCLLPSRGPKLILRFIVSLWVPPRACLTSAKRRLAQNSIFVGQWMGRNRGL